MNRFNGRNKGMGGMGGGGGGGGGRRFNGFDGGPMGMGRDQGFDRPRYNVSPWQGGMMPSMGGGGGGGGGPPSSEATTIALASNLINMLQSRQNPMPSLLDLNVQRDFGRGPGRGQFMRNAPDRFGPGKIGGRNAQLGGPMNRRLNAGGNRLNATIGGGVNKIRRPARPNQQAGKPKPAQKVSQETAQEVKTENVTESNVKVEGDETAENLDTTAEGGNENKTDSTIKTEYDGITQDFLECQICDKKMWDGRSFENHIKGRGHNIMMDKTKQSYMMTADAMRQELKIHEMKRNKRGFQPGAKKVFCAMCDLYVYNASVHRRSPGHQKLKKYLHPACNTCRKEFPTRIELDEHRLTAPHLRLLEEKQKDLQSKPKPEVMTISTLQEELSLVRTNDKQKKVKKENEAANTESTQNENGEAVNTTQDSEAAAVEEKPDESVPLLLDYNEGDDLSNMTRANLPRYQMDRQVGNSYLQKVTYTQCVLCKKMFDTDETAEVHLRTWKHFQSFIRLMHLKGNFKNPEAGNKRALDDSTNEEEGGAKVMKLEDDSVINEDDLINGTTTNGEGHDETTEDNIPEDSLLADTSGNDDSILDTSASEVNTTVESVTVKPEIQNKPKGGGNRGRGRGRGMRGRRGRY